MAQELQNALRRASVRSNSTTRLAREHDLCVMQCERRACDVPIGTAGELRVVDADALHRRRVLGTRSAEELPGLFLLLLEIDVIGQGARGVRIGGHEQPPSKAPDVLVDRDADEQDDSERLNDALGISKLRGACHDLRHFQQFADTNFSGHTWRPAPQAASHSCLSNVPRHTS